MKSVVFLFIVGIFLFTGCSKDEEVITPSGPTNVAAYEGLSDQSKNCSVTIGDIGGKSYVIGYSISYSYDVLGGTATETHSKSNTDGIAELVNNNFTINTAQNSPNGTITGARSGGTVTGNFNFKVIRITNDTVTVSGAFNLTKK
ncbi:MAG: hypothetical protein AB9882_00400 [Ignavibacteriaceae bacterium]